MKCSLVGSKGQRGSDTRRKAKPAVIPGVAQDEDRTPGERRLGQRLPNQVAAQSLALPVWMDGNGCQMPANRLAPSVCLGIADVGQRLPVLFQQLVVDVPPVHHERPYELRLGFARRESQIQKAQDGFKVGSGCAAHWVTLSPFTRSTRGLHLRDFHDSSVAVIGLPLTRLIALLKIPRPHFRAVQPEPFPIAVEQPIQHFAFGAYASVLVAIYSFHFMRRFLRHKGWR